MAVERKRAKNKRDKSRGYRINEIKNLKESDIEDEEDDESVKDYRQLLNDFFRLIVKLNNKVEN